MPNHHAVLRLSPGASRHEIKTSYKKLALIYHPDKNQENKTQAGAHFIKIKAAYDALMSGESAKPTPRESRSTANVQGTRARANTYTSTRSFNTQRPRAQTNGSWNRYEQYFGKSDGPNRPMSPMPEEEEEYYEYTSYTYTRSTRPSDPQSPPRPSRSVPKPEDKPSAEPKGTRQTPGERDSHSYPPYTSVHNKLDRCSDLIKDMLEKYNRLDFLLEELSGKGHRGSSPRRACFNKQMEGLSDVMKEFRDGMMEINASTRPQETRYWKENDIKVGMLTQGLRLLERKLILKRNVIDQLLKSLEGYGGVRVVRWEDVLDQLDYLVQIR
jgi:curved DNA-binding protein CbpA